MNYRAFFTFCFFVFIAFLAVHYFGPGKITDKGQRTLQKMQGSNVTKIIELKKEGKKVNDLIGMSFTISEMKEAGFTIQEFKDANFKKDELKNIGFEDVELNKIFK